jgi:hypothetical protein
MRIRKPMAISGAIVAAGLSGLVGAQVVNAASDTSGSQGLVDKIASTFNLNKSDVQKVFDEERQQREANREQKFEDRVNQAVKDGKLSQTLADQLIAKQKELATYRDSLKDKTPKERRDLMKVKRDELRSWAKQNNISLNLIGPAHPDDGAPDDDAGSSDTTDQSTPKSQ